MIYLYMAPTSGKNLGALNTEDYNIKSYSSKFVRH